MSSKCENLGLNQYGGHQAIGPAITKGVRQGVVDTENQIPPSTSIVIDKEVEQQAKVLGFGCNVMMEFQVLRR